MIGRVPVKSMSTAAARIFECAASAPCSKHARATPEREDAIPAALAETVSAVDRLESVDVAEDDAVRANSDNRAVALTQADVSKHGDCHAGRGREPQRVCGK